MDDKNTAEPETNDSGVVLNSILNDESVKKEMSMSTSSISLNQLIDSNNNTSLSLSDSIHNLAAIGAGSNVKLQNNNSIPLNEKVASLASSIYTELEKIVKLYGRDTVKDLMSIVVNILGIENLYFFFIHSIIINLISNVFNN